MQLLHRDAIKAQLPKPFIACILLLDAIVNIMGVPAQLAVHQPGKVQISLVGFRQIHPAYLAGGTAVNIKVIVVPAENPAQHPVDGQHQPVIIQPQLRLIIVVGLRFALQHHRPVDLQAVIGGGVCRMLAVRADDRKVGIALRRIVPALHPPVAPYLYLHDPVNAHPRISRSDIGHIFRPQQHGIALIAGVGNPLCFIGSIAVDQPFTTGQGGIHRFPAAIGAQQHHCNGLAVLIVPLYRRERQGAVP